VPGMFVDVRVPVGEPETVVAAPPTAIRHAPFGDQLFVIEPDPTDPVKLRAHQRFVRLGGSVHMPSGDLVGGVEGLKAGDRVAADGSFKRQDGALVSAPPPAAPASPASPEGSPGPGATTAAKTGAAP